MREVSQPRRDILRQGTQAAVPVAGVLLPQLPASGGPAAGNGRPGGPAPPADHGGTGGHHGGPSHGGHCIRQRGRRLQLTHYCLSAAPRTTQLLLLHVVVLRHPTGPHGPEKDLQAAPSQPPAVHTPHHSCHGR